MCVSDKNHSPTTSLGESFLPIVRFVLSFFPNDCHPNRRNLNTSTAVCYRKSLIINDNSRWFQQTCISSCQPEMPVTSKLVKKKGSLEASRSSRDGCGALGVGSLTDVRVH